MKLIIKRDLLALSGLQIKKKLRPILNSKTIYAKKAKLWKSFFSDIIAIAMDGSLASLAFDCTYYILYNIAVVFAEAINLFEHLVFCFFFSD